MSEQKKFLDYEGIKYLWSKINMQDYPNNETLINVINAIDETKVDRNELVQSDWNESNASSMAYVKNRPFYEETGVTSIVLFDGDISFQMSVPSIITGTYDEPKEFEVGKTYSVTVGNEKQDIVCQLGVNYEDFETKELTFISSELNMIFRFGEWEVYVENCDSYESSYYVKIETTGVSTTLKQLDEKFIPSTIPVISTATVGQTIAVKAIDEDSKPTEWEAVDIPEQVQSDWTQTDETATNYIKNKPVLATSEEIKALFN